MVNLEPIDVDIVLVDLPADTGARGPPADINVTSGTAWMYDWCWQARPLVCDGQFGTY